MKIACTLRKFFIVLSLMLALGTARGQWVALKDTTFGSWLDTVGYAGALTGSSYTGWSLDTTNSHVANDTILPYPSMNVMNYREIKYFKSLKYFAFPPSPTLTNWYTIDTVVDLPQGILGIRCTTSSVLYLPDSLGSIYIQCDACTTFPSLPDSLINLYLDVANLPVLPTIPASLLSLNLAQFSGDSLPPIPNTLRSLSWDMGQYRHLPPHLPDSLRLLSVDSYPDTALPQLPPYLDSLMSYGGNFRSIPSLPTSLLCLSSSWGAFPTLPALPSGLKVLNCNSNQLITQLPALPSGLETLDYNNTGIRNNLITYPPTLQFLNFSNNNDSVIPALPNTIVSLDCSDNYLTFIPHFPDSLRSLNIGGNPLLPLIPSLPNCPGFSMQAEWDNFNQLPQLPDSMYMLDLSNASVGCMPIINKIANFSCLNSTIYCQPNHGHIDNLLGTEGPPCDIMNPHNCIAAPGICGKLYIDRNGNCILDDADASAVGIRVRLYRNAQFQGIAYTRSDGFYNFPDPGFGTFQIIIDTGSNNGLFYQTTCGDSLVYNSTISIHDSVQYSEIPLICSSINSYNNDFAVLPDYNHYFRPGNSFTYTPQITRNINPCSDTSLQPVNATVILNGPVRYLGNFMDTPSYVSANRDTIVWDSIYLNLNTPLPFLISIDSGAQIGDSILINCTIFPQPSDINLSNNSFTSTCYIYNSIDPNRKSVSPSGNVLATQDWLTYTIEFQNTGNAPAINIHLIDTLDDNLDASSLQILSAPSELMYQQNLNVAYFYLANINLPDSADDEPASRGYITYRIKMIPGLAAGTIIQNKAQIYFDLNSPVATNTTSSRVTSGPCSASFDTISQNICSGDSIIFGYTSYDTTGAYTDTLTATTGCDSIVTLNLTVNPVYNTDLYDTICAGTSYIFFGRSLSSSATYNHYLFTVNSCDSQIILHLTVTPSLTSFYYDTTCMGSTYTFHGQILTQSGTYTDTLLTAAGCDSLVTLYLIVTPPLSSAIYDTTCANAPYSFYGQILTQSGTYADTVQTAGGCDSIITLYLTVNPAFDTAMYDTICQGSSFTFFTRTLTQGGIYADTLYSTSGCDSIVTLYLMVAPSSNNILYDTICAGASYSFAGQTLTQSGIYVDTAYSLAGCYRLATLHLTVRTIGTSLYDTTCASQPFYFLGQTFTQSGVYVDTLYGARGCDSVVSLYLTVYPAWIGTQYDTICAGSSFAFDGYILTQSGTLTDTLYSSGSCDSILTLHLLVDTPRIPVISASGFLLDGATLGGVSFQWYMDGLLIPGATADYYQAAQPDVYTISMTDAAGCSDTSAPFVLTTGIAEAGQVQHAISLHPNPNSGSFILQTTSRAGDEFYTICDMIGRQIARGLITSDAQSITAPVSVGVYQITVRSDGAALGTLRFEVVK